jgi:hypothetical protein
MVLADHGSSNQFMVGLAGFEPAASCTQSRRASQAALQPVPGHECSGRPRRDGHGYPSLRRPTFVCICC